MNMKRYLYLQLFIVATLLMSFPVCSMAEDMPLSSSDMLSSSSSDTNETTKTKDQLKEEKKKAKNHAKFEKRQAKRQAKQQKRHDKAVARAKKEADKIAEKLAKLEPQRVYFWGAGINFNDSVVYVTEFQHLDSIFIEPTGELREHYSYTSDLNFYLESHYGLQNETCAVYYMADEKKALKRFDKLFAKLQKRGFIINTVSQKEFAFKRPVPEPVAPAENK